MFLVLQFCVSCLVCRVGLVHGLPQPQFGYLPHHEIQENLADSSYYDMYPELQNPYPQITENPMNSNFHHSGNVIEYSPPLERLSKWQKNRLKYKRNKFKHYHKKRRRRCKHPKRYRRYRHPWRKQSEDDDDDVPAEYLNPFSEDRVFQAQGSNQLELNGENYAHGATYQNQDIPIRENTRSPGELEANLRQRTKPLRSYERIQSQLTQYPFDSSSPSNQMYGGTTTSPTSLTLEQDQKRYQWETHRFSPTKLYGNSISAITQYPKNLVHMTSPLPIWKYRLRKNIVSHPVNMNHNRFQKNQKTYRLQGLKPLDASYRNKSRNIISQDKVRYPVKFNTSQNVIEQVSGKMRNSQENKKVVLSSLHRMLPELPRHSYSKPILPNDTEDDFRPINGQFGKKLPKTYTYPNRKDIYSKYVSNSEDLITVTPIASLIIKQPDTNNDERSVQPSARTEIYQKQANLGNLNIVQSSIKVNDNENTDNIVDYLPKADGVEKKIPDGAENSQYIPKFKTTIRTRRSFPKTNFKVSKTPDNMWTPLVFDQQTLKLHKTIQGRETDERIIKKQTKLRRPQIIRSKFQGLRTIDRSDTFPLMKNEPSSSYQRNTSDSLRRRPYQVFNHNADRFQITDAKFTDIVISTTPLTFVKERENSYKKREFPVMRRRNWSSVKGSDSMSTVVSSKIVVHD